MVHPDDAEPSSPVAARHHLSGGCLAVFEHAPDAMFIVNDDRLLVETNAAAGTLLSMPRATLLGRCIHDFFLPRPEYQVTDLPGRWKEFIRGGERQDECLVVSHDGTRRVSYHARANVLPGLHLFIAHDVTEWRFAEGAVRQAEQLYRTLVETTDTGYLVADTCGCVLDANAEYVNLSGHVSLDEIVGRHPLEWTAPGDRDRLAAEIARCFRDGHPLRDLEIDFLDVQGRVRPVEINATAVAAGDGTRLLCLCHDITNRVLARRELEDARLGLERRVERRTAELANANAQIRSRARQQESVADLGRRALAGADLDELMREAAETVCAVLGVAFSGVVEHADPEGQDLVLRAVHGWSETRLGKPFGTTDPAFLGGYALASTAPVIIEDWSVEDRFQMSPHMVGSGVCSSMVVPIGGESQPFGLISAHSLQPRRFSPDDIYFQQSIANVLAAAIERKRSEEIVRLAQQGAVSANNAKIEFLSRMSHELRTPLNAILGFSQLLEIERLDPRQRESVEQITRAGRHLLELVNEVLDISRIDSGNINLTPEPLGVDDLAREALDLIRPLAVARGIALTPGAGAIEPGRHLLADRQRIRQVLLNLLSNAVKYNREGGRVTLDAGPSPDGKRVRLSVVDTGPGIAEEHFPLLFTPFERLGAEKTGVEGSGIGLALAKRLVESQGGELGVTSELGVGTTFWVDLPVAAAPLADTDALRLEELFGAEFFPPGEGDDGQEAKPLPPPPRTVLHIEDNEPNQLLVEMLMRKRPALRLLTASRGQEGLAMARTHRPDLILLDMHLPDTTGECVLQLLRGDEDTKRTPVVMVSADAAAMRRNQEEVTGANSYLTKPFNVAQFLKLLDQYLVRGAA